MALKDWKKEGVRFWQTKKGFPTGVKFLSLSVLKSNKATWNIVFQRGGNIPKIIRVFKTRSKALKFAKFFMSKRKRLR